MKASLMMLLAALVSVQPALADDDDDDDHHHRHRHRHHCDDHWGRVTEVIPIYEEVEVREPYESCDIEYEEEGGGYSATPAIIGGIVGAAIGNGVGHGKRNKQVGAVAGGLLGASIGHDLGGRSRAGGRSSGREVCETRYRISYREELVGYEVHYRHHGRRYQSRSRHHPGDRYWLGDDHRH